ncbi:MAG: hypothetical protein JW973_08295 [Bacteroidales bacterium]|nr:hypothetical protein [Bacteroidales bacterium]
MKKSATIFLIVTAFLSIGYGQEPTRENPVVYVNDAGRIYINKQLPVYLWISTSPEENAPAYRLTSDSSKNYSNPMYFDTEGRNTVRSPWCVDTVTKQMIYPAADIIFDVYADGKPPVTRAKLTGKIKFTRDKTVVYRDKVTIALLAADAVSGTSSSYYSLNGGSFEKYSDPLTIEDKGNYVLSYYSVDFVGNREAIREIKFALE